MSDKRKTCEEWYILSKERRINEGEVKYILWDWQGDRVELIKVANDRKKLLEEVRQLLDTIYAEDIVSSGDLGKVYEKIERELAKGSGE